MNTTVKKALHYCIFLLALGIICGGLLALVNSFTAPVIAEYEENKVQAELKEIFGQDSKFPQTNIPEGSNSAITNVYYWYDSNNVLKGICYKTSTYGYQSDIVLIVAFSVEDDSVIGFKVTKAAESRGDTFGHDFGVIGQGANNISINNMSGASVSSAAVKKGITIAAKNYLENKASLIGGANND